jgi:hypothetical protein
MTTREDVQAMLDKGNHPLVLVREYIKLEDREGAEAALELGSSPNGRLSGVQQVSLRRSIDARFPESDADYKKRRGEKAKQMRSEVAGALARRKEQRLERAAALYGNSKPSRGPNATLPHISEEIPDSEVKPVWGLKVRR